ASPPRRRTGSASPAAVRDCSPSPPPSSPTDPGSVRDAGGPRSPSARGEERRDLGPRPGTSPERSPRLREEASARGLAGTHLSRAFLTSLGLIPRIERTP